MIEGCLSTIALVSEKEEKMYKAVKILLDEGREIDSLKVSDITQKAGIGKGTAYEYFNSKEEMIAKAILYGVSQDVSQIRERAMEKENFIERYMAILDWLEEIYREEGSIPYFFRIMQSPSMLSGGLRGELEQYIPDIRLIHEQLALLIRQGHEEGSLKSKLSEGLQTAVVWANLLSFWNYMQTEAGLDPENCQFAKNHLCKCLMHNLTV